MHIQVEDRYQQTSELFHLLSHPVRLRILDEVRRHPACVCHLQAVLDRPQAYVSQQLSVLREAGLVIDERDGLFVFYRLADQRTERLLEQSLGPARDRTVVTDCPCPRCRSESSR